MQSKFSHVISLLFAVLVIFGLVGSIVSPKSVFPAACFLFVVLGWSTGRIVREGVESAKYLYILMNSDTDKSTKNTNDSDNKS